MPSLSHVSSKRSRMSWHPFEKLEHIDHSWRNIDYGNDCKSEFPAVVMLRLPAVKSISRDLHESELSKSKWKRCDNPLLKMKSIALKMVFIVPPWIAVVIELSPDLEALDLETSFQKDSDDMGKLFQALALKASTLNNLRLERFLFEDLLRSTDANAHSDVPRMSFLAAFQEIHSVQISSVYILGATPDCFYGPRFAIGPRSKAL